MYINPLQRSNVGYTEMLESRQELLASVLCSFATTIMFEIRLVQPDTVL